MESLGPILVFFRNFFVVIIRDEYCYWLCLAEDKGVEVRLIIEGIDRVS